MLECLILGDSIATGIEQHRPECVQYAKVGINSTQWNMLHGHRDLLAGTVIISLGSNDHKFVKTERELETLRSKVHGRQVFWILPQGNNPEGGVSIEHIQMLVLKIASRYKDRVLGFEKYVSSDGIHPTAQGYRELAKATK
jgi:hypothetical protein